MSKIPVNRRTDNTITKERRKRTNNDLQNITQKTKYRAARTLQKPGANSGALEGLAVSCI